LRALGFLSLEALRRESDPRRIDRVYRLARFVTGP
jgi:hypothetical protein